MFTSDTERRSIFYHLIFHVGYSAFLVLFGAIYEVYSHGVYSYFMMYAFVVPFVMGVIPYLFIGLFAKILPSELSKNLWNYGIVTLSLGSVMRGVLDIYGTDNFTVYPFLAGVPLAVAGLVAYIFKIAKK